MSIAPIEAEATFGAGGAEPYAHALRRDGQVLYLRDTASHASEASSAMSIARWRDDADAVDISLLNGHSGSVLDIGCGPGRMVKAAHDRRLLALGIDVSATAVAIARESGLPVIHRSIFDLLPHEGDWDLALLLDGNVGIGGDVNALLARCMHVLAPAGALLVEVNPDPTHDRQYNGTITDIHGRRSATFPWAEIGRAALTTRARQCGLVCVQVWETRTRAFCRLVKA